MGKGSPSTFTDEQGRLFGSEARRLRADAGFNLRQFAELIGVTENYYCKIEHGKKCPSPQLADRIANAFDTTAEQMLVAKLPELGVSDDKVWEFRKKYGAALKQHREEKGLPCSVVAGALGIPTAVYKEYEQGLCSITDRQMELLDKLLGIGEKPKVVEKEIIVEVPAEVPTGICDTILTHIKDLQISEDEQKEVWRYFSKIKLDAEERRLFG